MTPEQLHRMARIAPMLNLRLATALMELHTAFGTGLHDELLRAAWTVLVEFGLEAESEAT